MGLTLHRISYVSMALIFFCIVELNDSMKEKHDSTYRLKVLLSKIHHWGPRRNHPERSPMQICCCGTLGETSFTASHGQLYLGPAVARHF